MALRITNRLLFPEMRPVYQRRGGSGDPVYLYYYKNLLYSVWVIGPDYRRDGAFAYVSDKALSSDYINGTWLVDNNGKFEVSLCFMQGGGEGDGRNKKKETHFGQIITAGLWRAVES